MKETVLFYFVPKKKKKKELKMIKSDSIEKRQFERKEKNIQNTGAEVNVTNRVIGVKH